MPIVHLYGTLHPKHHRLCSQKAFGINWGSDDLGFPLIMEGKIVDSSFEVSCDLPRFEESMVSILCARAGNLIRAFSDAASFGTGVGFVATWESIKKPDGSLCEIQRVNFALGSLCTSYRFPPRTDAEQSEFELVLRIVLSEPNLMGSLTDLADTLAFFHQTPTNCARVLDSLRRSVAPAVKPTAGWSILQSLLRVNQSFMEFVSARSTGTRHGDRTTDIPEEEIMEISRRTWQIVDRFIEFRKRGSVQLPEDQFRDPI